MSAIDRERLNERKRSKRKKGDGRSASRERDKSAQRVEKELQKIEKKEQKLETELLKLAQLKMKLDKLSQCTDDQKSDLISDDVITKLEKFDDDQKPSTVKCAMIESDDTNNKNSERDALQRDKALNNEEQTSPLCEERQEEQITLRTPDQVQVTNGATSTPTVVQNVQRMPERQGHAVELDNRLPVPAGDNSQSKTVDDTTR